jgi:outer membrane protein assembly factor BamA
MHGNFSANKMRMKFSVGKIPALLAVILFILGGPAISNSFGQEKYALAAIKFTGLNRFSEAQVSRATGLRVGDSVSQPQLAAAADRLAKSGAFEHVSFRYFTEKNQLTVEFELTEIQKLLACRFENFVWFSDQQLDQALRSRVPFYAGGVPEGGTTVEEVRAALHDLLRANGIPGEVDATPVSAGLGQPVSIISFTVRGVSLPIRTVDFPGASVVSPKDLLRASSQIINRDFSVTNVATFASAGLLPLYGERGHLRARFERPQAKVVSKDADGTVQEIGVTLPVEEGREYYWEKAEWSGNQKFSSEELSHILDMKPKEVANQQKIDAGLERVMHAYQQQGYIDAAVQPNVILDDGTQLTTYDVAVVEGLQYRIGQVHFDGLTEAAVAQLVKKWRLKPGDIFDSPYALDFVKKIAPQTLHDLGITRTSVEVNPQRDKQKAVVDLHIVYH